MLKNTRLGKKMLRQQRRKGRSAKAAKSGVDRAQNKRIRKIEKLLTADKKMSDVPVPVQLLQQPDVSGVGIHCYHMTNQFQLGDRNYEREGNKITLKNLFLNLKVSAEANVPLSIVNLVCVHFPEGITGNLTPGTLYGWDTVGEAIDRFNQMTTSLPEPIGGLETQYVADDNLYGDNQSTFLTQFNPNVAFRYNILFNKQIKLNNGSTATTFGSKHEKFLRIPLKKQVDGKIVQYDSIAETVVAPVQVVKGSIVLYAWSDRPSTETGRPAVGGCLRAKWIG